MGSVTESEIDVGASVFAFLEVPVYGREPWMHPASFHSSRLDILGRDDPLKRIRWPRHILEYV